MSRYSRYPWLWTSAGALALLIGARAALTGLPRSLAAARSVQALASSAAAAHPTAISTQSGLSAYLQGLASQATGAGDVEAWWAWALASDERFVDLVHTWAPDSLPLARLAAETYPDSYHAWEWLGDASSDGGDVLDAYRRAVEMAPHANLVWEKVSARAGLLGDWELSAEAARHACELNPIRNGSCHHAARLAYADGDWEAVIHYFELGDDPEHPEDWARLIRAAQRLGLDIQAKAYLVQAQAESPADYAALLAAVE